MRVHQGILVAAAAFAALAIPHALAQTACAGSTGYDSETYEHMFRVSDVTTVSTHLMHEARASFRFEGETDVPTSTIPQVNVAGAFVDGGATIGQQRLREFNLEADDDAILTTRHYTMKFGTQFMLFNEHQQLTTNFNGTYTFGGGPAPVLDGNNQPIPGETTTITGVQQYQRAVLGLAGGNPTAYSNVAGTPAVNFTLVRNTLFFQDDWEVGHGVHVAYGVRYLMENDPTILNAAVPRLGVLWSNKKGTMTLHAHAGMFSGQFSPSDNAVGGNWWLLGGLGSFRGTRVCCPREFIWMRMWSGNSR